MQISAILSDYDGTLIPTSLLNPNNNDIKKEAFDNNNISKTELERVLWDGKYQVK